MSQDAINKVSALEMSMDGNLFKILIQIHVTSEQKYLKWVLKFSNSRSVAILEALNFFHSFPPLTGLHPIVHHALEPRQALNLHNPLALTFQMLGFEQPAWLGFLC